MTDEPDLEGKLRERGEIWKEIDSILEIPIIKRIDPQTGKTQELVQGGTGLYWGDSEYIIRDEYGFVIDLG